MTELKLRIGSRKSELALKQTYIIEDLLKNVFSRSGFTDGYYTENLGRDMFGIRTKEDVTAADTAFSALHSLYRGERQSVKISVALTAKADTPLRLLKRRRAYRNSRG